jgi:hypothetical protein
MCDGVLRARSSQKPSETQYFGQHYHYDMATILIDAQATSVMEVGARHVDGPRRGEQLAIGSDCKRQLSKRHILADPGTDRMKSPSKRH